MEEILPEQQAQLVTWASQRDSLLLEISNLKSENEKLQQVNKSLAESNTDIETRINEGRGRIEELKIKEQEFIPLVSKEIDLLQLTKTGLESEVYNLRRLIEALVNQKASLEIDISFALSTFNIVKNEGLLLEKIVDHVTTVSSANITKIESLVEWLTKTLEEMVDVNRKNVAETNLVLDKLPKMLIELQKVKLIRNKI